MLGVGLELYGGARKEDRPSPNRNVTPIRKARSSGTESSGNAANGRLSAKQHQYLMRLSQDRGMTRQELNDHCVAAYGAAVDFINRQDASRLIEALRSVQGPVMKGPPEPESSMARTMHGPRYPERNAPGKPGP